MNTNYEIDKYIDYIVMHFELDDTTNYIIAKLSKMYDREDLIIGPNYIEVRDTYFTRRVTIDKSDKHIELLEKGSKKENYTVIDFTNSVYYSLNNGDGICVKIVTEDISDKYGVIKNKKSISKQFSYGKVVATKITNNEDKYKNDNGNLVKIVSSNYECLEYNLPRGTSIKSIENDGKVDYYKKDTKESEYKKTNYNEYCNIYNIYENIMNKKKR